MGCGKTENEEKKLAEHLGITKKVRFLGNRDNVRDYLLASDIYLMPSLYEGLGMAAVEAMASNTPSIFYNVPGLKDLIKNNNNGLLIESNYKLLADSINWMITNKDKTKVMANNALEFVNKEFDMKTNTTKIMDLYKKNN